MPVPLGFGNSAFDHGCGTLDDNAQDNVFFKSYLATLAATGGAFDVTMWNGTEHSATGIVAIGDDTIQVTAADDFHELWFISDIRTISSLTAPPVVICESSCH